MKATDIVYETESGNFFVAVSPLKTTYEIYAVTYENEDTYHAVRVCSIGMEYGIEKAKNRADQIENDFEYNKDFPDQ